MRFAIGIDIGTANTRVAVFRRGKVEIIPDEDGNELMPSYVAFGEQCRLFGGAAKAQAEFNSKNTIYGIKPFLGCSPAGSDRERSENSDLKNMPFIMERSDNQEFIVTAQYKGRSQRFTLVDIFAMLLVKAKQNAEAYLAETVSEAVISVPVRFDYEQRHHVQDAAAIAGIRLLRICTAIESIALHVYAADERYGHRPHREPQEDKIVAIIDQGTNSSNIGLARINHGTIRILGQHTTYWPGHGGYQLARCVARCIEDQVSAKHILRPKDVEQHQLARASSEAIMKELTLNSWTPVRIHTLGGKYDCTVILAREDFEMRVLKAYRDADFHDWDMLNVFMRVSKTSVSDISQLIMVGGCSEIPVVQRHWSRYFGDTPFSLSSKPDPTIYIYEVQWDRNLLIGELDVRSLLSYPDLMTEIKIVIEVGPSLSDIQVTAESPEIGKSVKYVRRYFIDREQVQSWRSAELGYQQDDEAGAVRIIDGNAAFEKSSASKYTGSSEHKPEPEHLLKTLGQFRSLIGQSGLNLGLISFSEVQETVERLSHDGQMKMATSAQLQEMRVQLEETRFALLSTTQTPEVLSLLESVLASQRLLQQYQTSTSLDHQGRFSVTNNSEHPLESPGQPSTINGPKPHVGSLNLDRASGSDPLINGAVDVPLKSGWDAEQRYTDAEQRYTDAEQRYTDAEQRYTDAELEDIAAYLRNTGHEDWSTVPRIYVVLRTIGHVELIEHFFQRGMTDIWFPFSDTTLPNALTQPSRGRFLQAQGAVLSEALCLEKGINPDNGVSRRTHIRVANEDALPFKVIANLGGGAHGMVDKVVSSLSYRKYARKRFNKPEVGANYARKFLNELDLLKSMSHVHCVDLIGSYSDPTHIALIMTPVADCNLETFFELSLVDKDKQTLMRAFFGCLAGAVDYLHGQKVIHQNIKPQNILVKDDRALLTDFGFSSIWKDLTRNSTAAGLSRTYIYTAPEAARGGIKNQAADMWSLGCVFLEMCTVLRGLSVSTMRNFFDERT
ncbi:hypothetical protein Daus18300_010762 [Diaporthe australafricana]|uniref:Protein kinase domain-containing protein n=1 Tax=Diaporthe australafricana TaxID=127596 RepID=A0ABR3W935_9PEZI